MDNQELALIKSSTSKIKTSGSLAVIDALLSEQVTTVFGYPGGAIMGDGGAQMNIQELGTIMQFQPNVKILILNNHFLGITI